MASREKAFGIIQEVPVVAKRDQQFFDRNLQKARESLVVALDLCVNDPTVTVSWVTSFT